MLAPLKNKKKIELLFRLGEKKSSGFFECRCLSSSDDEGVFRFVVVAPKKNFPRAVDRNKIKRMIREAYRINKATFYEALHSTNTHMQFALIYQLEEIVAYSVIEEKIKLVLLRLSKKI